MAEDKNTFYCSFVSIHYIVCECGESFPTEDDLRGHFEREHGTKKERKQFKCGVCSRIFKTEESCVKHYKKSHLYIKEEHDYVAEFVKHEAQEDDEQSFIIDDTQDSEIKTELTPLEYDETEFDQETQFDQDTETFDQETEIYDQDTEFIVQDEADISTIHAEYIEDDSELIENDDFVEDYMEVPKPKKKSYNTKNIVCEVCGKKYASNAALKYHQRVHTGERPYQCNMCSKSFTMPLFLQIHVRTHTGERPYQCQLCPKAFSNKAALLRHDRVHTGIKPYACKQCGKTFTQSNSMKLHVNTVHLKMPAPYKSKARKDRARQRIREVLVKKERDETTIEAKELRETIEYVKQEEYQNVEEEVLYEDVDSRAITYEIIYE